MKRHAMLIGGLLLAAQLQAQQPTAPSTASGCSPDMATVKKAALDLHAKIGGDAWLDALDQAMGMDGRFLLQNRDLTLTSSDEISIFAMFPYQIYRIGLVEAQRKLDPIESVALPPPGVMVAVSPSRIDSPDVIKIVVEREGKVIAPIANRLLPTPMTTRLGAKSILHSGEVVFPCSAFEPGAPVKITAIPESGSNISHTPDDTTLLEFSGQRSRLLFSVIGKKPADVEQLLGKADSVEYDGAMWSYLVGKGVIRVYFKNGVAGDVDPRGFDTKDFKKQ